MPLDLSQFKPVDDSELGQFTDSSVDLSQFTPVDENDLQDFTSAESSDALRLRQRALNDQVSQGDQRNLYDQSILGIGEGLSSLQRPAAGIASFLGATDTGKRLADSARQSQAEYEDLADTLGTSTSAQVFRGGGEFAGQMAPLIAANAIAPGATPFVGGLQSLGDIQEQATEKYMADGDSYEEAARKARLPAAVGGLISAAVFKFVPGGIQGLTEKLISGEVIPAVAKQIIIAATKSALAGYPIGFIDQFAKDVAAKFTYQPDKPWGEILADAHAAGSGMVGVHVAAAPFKAAGKAALGEQTETVPLEGPVAPDQAPLQGQRTSNRFSRYFDEVTGQPLEDGPGPTVEPNAPIIGPRPLEAADKGRVTLGKKILTSAGFDPEYATKMSEAFASMYDPAAQFDGEAYRQALLTMLDANGARPETSVGKNAARRQTQAERNAQVLEHFQRVSRESPTRTPPITEQAPPEQAQPQSAREPIFQKGGEPNGQEQTQVQTENQNVGQQNVLIPQGGAVAQFAASPQPVQQTFRNPAGLSTQVTFRSPRALLPESTSAEPLQNVQQLLEPPAVVAKNAIPEQVPTVAENATVQPAPQARTKPVSSYERPPDIVDWVAENGKLRKIGPGEKSAISDQWRAVQKARPELFLDNGSAPDVAAENYRRTTGKDISDGDFLQEIIETGSRRAKQKADFYRGEKFRDQDAAFQSQIVENTGTGKSKTRPMLVDQLQQGQVFKGRNQEIQVSKVGLDAVQFRDGPKFGTQTVPSGTVIHIDKGTLRNPKKTSTSPIHGPAGEASQAGSQPREVPQKAQGPNDTPWTPGVNDPFSLAPTVGDSSATDTFTPEQKAVAEHALEILQNAGLDASKIEAAISRSLPPGVSGTVSGNLVRFASNAAPETVAEEFLHIVVQGLPEDVRTAADSERKAQAQADGAPLEVIAGNLTSRQFADAGIDKRWYPLSNVDEYVTQNFAKKAAAEALAGKKGIWARIKDWFAKAWEAFKRLLSGDKVSVADKIAEDLTNGRIQVDPEKAFARAQERASFVTTEREARTSADLANTPEAKKIEGQEFLAQIDAPVKLMEAHGVQNLSRSLQRKFDFIEAKGIQQVGEQNHGSPADFHTLTAGAPPWLRQYLGAMAHATMVRFDFKFKQLVDDGAKANAELNSPEIQDKIRKLQSTFLATMAHEAAFKASQIGIQTALNQALDLLKHEHGSDLQMEKLRAQIRTLREVGESRVAMERLLDDMTRVLLSTLEGKAALTTGATSQEITRIYKDIKKSVNQPLAAAESLIGVASYLLSRMPEMRDQLIAAHYAQQSGPLAAARARLKPLLDGLRSNPATLERMMKTRENKAANLAAAEFLYFHMQKELTRELDPIYDRMKAGQVASNILVDPNYQRYADMVSVAGKVNAMGKPFEPFVMTGDAPGGNVYNPKSGQFLTNLGPDLLSGNSVLIGKRYREATAYLSDANDWLNHNSPDHPLYQRVTDERDAVETYWGNVAMLTPNHRDDPVRWTLSILDRRIKLAGGRVEVQAQKAKAGLNNLSHVAKAWTSKAGVRLGELRTAAMRSHGLKWNNFGSKDLHWASTQFDPHWQELSNSNQFRHGQLKVGDKSMAGWTVTKEDIALLNEQATFDRESYALVEKWDRQVTQDTRGLSDEALQNGLTIYRKATQVSEHTLPRTLNYERFPALLPVRDAFDANAKEPTANTLTALSAALDHIWPIHGDGFLAQRNADFAQPTMFDGAGGAFEAVAKEIRNGARMDSFDAVVDRISQLSGEPVDSVRNVVASEFGRITASHVRQNYNESDPSKTVRVTGTDPMNPFTIQRGKQSGPWTFYKTGWSSGGDVMAHGGHMISLANHRMEQGLRAQLADLERQKNELEHRARVLERSGSSKATPESIAENVRARQRGTTFDDWRNFDRRIMALRNSITEIEDARRPITRTQTSQVVGRYLSGVTRLLIGSTPTMIHNTGMVFPYRTISAMGAGGVLPFFQTLKISATQISKMVGSLAWSVVKVPFYTFWKGVYHGIANTMKGKGMGQLWQQVVRAWVQDVTKTAHERFDLGQEMIDAGVHFLPDSAAEYDNQFADAYYRTLPGLSADQKLTWKSKLALTPIVMLENTLLPVIAANPGMGDTTTNSTFWKFLNSSYGPNAIFATKTLALLKRIDRGYFRPMTKLFRKQNYSRTFDLANPTAAGNELDHQDLNLSANELSQWRSSFLSAGLNFDAKIVDYMSRLKADRNAQFLNPDELAKIANWGIDQFNRANQTNQPKALLARNAMLEFLRPLFNWPTRAAASFMSYMSVPTKVGDANTSDAQLKARKMGQWLTKFAVTFLFGVMVAGTISELELEGVVRGYKLAFYQQESNNRWPWEHENGGKQVQSFARYGLQSVPLLAIPVNSVLPQNSPARASFDPSFVMVEKTKDLLAWISAGQQTGDWWYKTPVTVSGFYQDAKIITPMLASQSGLNNKRNAEALAKRYGPEDKAKGGGFHSNSTEMSALTPFGPKLWNAAYNGDQTEVMIIGQQAMDVATKLNRKNARQDVQDLFGRGNYMHSALKELPTKSQYDAMLAKMSATQRAELMAAEADFTRAAATLGFKAPTFYKPDENPNQANLRYQTPIGVRIRGGAR